MQLRLTCKKSNCCDGLGSIAAITAPDGPAELAQYRGLRDFAEDLSVLNPNFDDANINLYVVSFW